jgi:hypothetical protein
MRLYAFGPRIMGLRTGISLGPEDFKARRRAVSAPADCSASNDSFIYVLRGDHGLFKVGISSNPVARLATLRTASPFPLKMVNVVMTQGPAERLEAATHNALANARCNGEWFDCPLSHIVAAINGCAYDLGRPIQAPPINMDSEQYVTAIFKQVARGYVPGQARQGGGALHAIWVAIKFWLAVLGVIFAVMVAYSIAAHAEETGACKGDAACIDRMGQAAAGFMAAVDACPITITNEQREILYHNLIKRFVTPEEINFVIKAQTDEISKMSPLDRAGFCSAIGDLLAEASAQNN